MCRVIFSARTVIRALSQVFIAAPHAYAQAALKEMILRAELLLTQRERIKVTLSFSILFGLLGHEFDSREQR
jgi:hypothetical protein